MPVRSRIVVASVSLAVVASAAVALPAPTATAAARRGLATVAAAPRVQRGARALGRLAGATVLHGTVALKPRHAAELDTYAAAVTSPRSPLYRHYLGKGEFAERYAPDRSTVAAVVAGLHAAGVTSTSVASDGLLVRFSATAAHASAAFHTSIERYRLADGRSVYAPDSAIRLPAAVAASVQGVVGLQNVVVPHNRLSRRSTARGLQPHTAADARPAVTSKSPVACAAATTAAKKYGGLTDRQIGDAYGVSKLQQLGRAGAGQTVAIFEGEPFLMSDLKAFDTCYFGASRAAAMLSRVHVQRVEGGSGVGPGEGEAILDVEDVSAMAPDATLEVYEAPITIAGLIEEYAQIVQDDSAKVVSSSYGVGCEPLIDELLPGIPQVENTIFEQAAVQGQTVAIAAGDSGSDVCAPNGSSTPVDPVLSADNDSSQPYVLAVGGTTITDATNPPVEKVWNDGANGGAASSGISQNWSAPSWQTGVPGFGNAKAIAGAEAVDGSTFCTAEPCREGPDVSAQADEFEGAITIYLAEAGGWTTIGGTSSAAPLWAGMLADIAGTSACVAQGGLGFVVPALYRLASDPSSYKASFNDVKVGNNDQYGAADALYAAGPNFDLATGLGTPRVTSSASGQGLAYSLCAASTQAPTVTAVSPQALPEAGGIITVTGTGFETGSTPDVASVQIGGVPVKGSDPTVHVTSPTTLTVTAPPSAAQAPSGVPGEGTGTYAVSVTLTNHRTSALTPSSRVIYYATGGGSAALPSVAGLTIAAGNLAGGRRVRVVGSGFSLGSGTPQVTFGGVAGTGVTVLNDSTLTAVVPAYTAGTTHCETALDPATDVCQTQVVVTTSNGSSATATIKPEFAGDAQNEGLDDSVEIVPADTEFDYVPAPHISSIAVDTGLAAGDGSSIATITGTGLGYLGTDWYNVGDYRQSASQNFAILAFGTGAQQGKTLFVALPPAAPVAHRVVEPVTVQSEGSPNIDDITSTPPSNAVNVTYAAVPTLSSVQVIRGGKVSPYRAGPNSGGSTLVVHGHGLTDTGVINFVDVGDSRGAASGYGDATAYVFRNVSDTSLTLSTPAANPAVDEVVACSLSGCSTSDARADVFTYYPLGQPVVTRSSPVKGRTNTRVTITGKHLGFVTAVYFGSVRSKVFRNAEGLLDPGDTTTVFALAPKQKKGAKVSLHVVTLESTVTGYGRSHTVKAATFTYK